MGEVRFDDFHLDEFLRVYKDFDLPSNTGKQTVRVRVLSDLELNARRDYALAESSRITYLLKDTASDLYRTKIGPLEDAAQESLIDILADARRTEFAREALDVYRLNFFPNPDNPTEEELIGVRLKQQAHEQEVFAARAKYVIENERAFREKMAGYSLDILLKETQARAVYVYAASVANDASTYYTVWCSTYVGKKKRWASAEEVKQLPPPIIDYLYAAYQEVDAIDPWALTKSESAGDAGGVGQDASGG
jgi:hypothetical protein